MVNKETLEENIKLKAEIEYLKKSKSLTRKLEVVTRKEKTKIVTELRTKFPLKILLEVAEMNSSVYYYNVNAMKEKINKYVEVEKQIDYLYLKKHKKRLVYQRIYMELKRESIKIGKNKVLEIMREKGYLKRKRKKWRKYNSYEGEIGKVYPNVLDRNFKTEKPYQKAGTDITMFPIKGESVYLSPIIDFNSREVLSYSVVRNAKMDKITYMLNNLRRKHKDRIKVMIIQFDQGVQYQNSRYNQKLEELGIVQSMSRKGSCLDNSPTENFFGRMKEEIWNGQEEKYLDSNHLIKTIHEYIKYYNETRIVMKLKMSPLEYRNSLNNSIE